MRAQCKDSPKDSDDDDDEGDQATGETFDEDVVEEHDWEEDEPVPEPKGKPKKAKRKATHPNFIFTGPASGWARSISARPMRVEETLTSTTYLQHLERAKSHVSEELGASLKQVSTHYHQCLAVTGLAIVA